MNLLRSKIHFCSWLRIWHAHNSPLLINPQSWCISCHAMHSLYCIIQQADHKKVPHPANNKIWATTPIIQRIASSGHLHGSNELDSDGFSPVVAKFPCLQGSKNTYYAHAHAHVATMEKWPWRMSTGQRWFQSTWYGVNQPSIFNTCQSPVCLDTAANSTSPQVPAKLCEQHRDYNTNRQKHQ